MSYHCLISNGSNNRQCVNPALRIVCCAFCTVDWMTLWYLSPLFYTDDPFTGLYRFCVSSGLLRLPFHFTFCFFNRIWIFTFSTCFYNNQNIQNLNSLLLMNFSIFELRNTFLSFNNEIIEKKSYERGHLQCTLTMKYGVSAKQLRLENEWETSTPIRKWAYLNRWTRLLWSFNNDSLNFIEWVTHSTRGMGG